MEEDFDKLISDVVAPRQATSARQIIESENCALNSPTSERTFRSRHPAIEAFIRSPPSWGVESAALAEFEWEVDNILLVFSGLKQRKVHLFQETSEFFEFEMPTPERREKLYLSEATSRKEPRDDDRDFFEAHRDNVGKDAHSAQSGSVSSSAGHRMHGFPGGPVARPRTSLRTGGRLQANRSLEIRTGKRTKNQWLELNGDVATSFAVRYRGCRPDGRQGEVDISHLFEYQGLLEAASKRKGYKRNVSTSRTSLQIRFDITLKIGADRTTVQLIWIGRPDAIGLELRDDLERLARRPLVRSTVSRNPSAARRTAINFLKRRLDAAASVPPRFRKPHSRLDGGDDVAKSFPKNLKRPWPLAA